MLSVDLIGNVRCSALNLDLGADNVTVIGLIAIQNGGLGKVSQLGERGTTELSII